VVENDGVEGFHGQVKTLEVLALRWRLTTLPSPVRLLQFLHSGSGRFIPRCSQDVIVRQ
jgi:hypothetical protein